MNRLVRKSALAVGVGLILLLSLAAAGARVSLWERTIALGLVRGGVELTYVSPTPKAAGGVQSWYLGLHGFKRTVTSL